VYEHFCELLPGDDPALIDGHMLVVLLDDSSLSEAFAEYCEKRITRLSDKSDFQIAIVTAGDFPDLSRRVLEFPATLHYTFGVVRSRVFGVDDCLEFLNEFILNNTRR
jgi:hypothetical protein